MTQTQVQELLKPRYKVIADWPGVAGKVMVGDILELDDLDDANVFWCAGEGFQEDKLKDYPHLFKKLEWWEERQESEMPKCLKIIIAKHKEDVGFVFEVDKYEPYYVADAEIPHESYLAYSKDIQDCIPMIFCEPATKEEYEAFINQTK